MKKPLISVEKCKGCGLCIGACPKKILEMSSAFNKQGSAKTSRLVSDVNFAQ